MLLPLIFFKKTTGLVAPNPAAYARLAAPKISSCLTYAPQHQDPVSDANRVRDDVSEVHTLVGQAPNQKDAPSLLMQCNTGIRFWPPPLLLQERRVDDAPGLNGRLSLLRSVRACGADS